MTSNATNEVGGHVTLSPGSRKPDLSPCDFVCFIPRFYFPRQGFYNGNFRFYYVNLGTELLLDIDLLSFRITLNAMHLIRVECG